MTTQTEKSRVDLTYCPRGHDAEMAAYLSCTPQACGLKTKSTWLLDGMA